MFVGLFLTATLIPLQSCSNTLIGEKLENSFDITENAITSGEITNGTKKLIEIKKIKLRKKEVKNENDSRDNFTENSKSNKDKSRHKSIKPIKKIIFNQQPYRIILRLSGANPAAPAETVTEALRKAGVQFEVEKIERFDEESLSKSTSFKR